MTPRTAPPRGSRGLNLLKTFLLPLPPRTERQISLGWPAGRYDRPLEPLRLVGPRHPIDPHPQPPASVLVRTPLVSYSPLAPVRVLSYFLRPGWHRKAHPQETPDISIHRRLSYSCFLQGWSRKVP